MASQTNPLDQFIRDALAQGKSEAEIKQTLGAVGWPAEQIEAGFQGWAGTAWGLPVPKPKTQVSARDAFYYLTLFFGLALSVWGMSFIWFALIDIWISDPLFSRPYRDEFRTPISILIVAFPVYFFLSLKIARDVRRDPDRRHSPVRRWITYTILFCAAVVMLIDLIVVIDGFLGGDLTAKSLAKAVTVALIHGVVFWGYLRMQGRDDRADQDARPGDDPLPRWLLRASALVALITIGLAFYNSQSPKSARAEQSDRHIVETLNNIEVALNCEWERTGTLPPVLDFLSTSGSQCYLVSSGLDAVRYTPHDEGRYTLCTKFEREGLPPRPIAGGQQPFSYHPAGAHCFERQVYRTAPVDRVIKPAPQPGAPTSLPDQKPVSPPPN